MKEILLPARWVLIGLFFISVSGCFQYPEGPFFTVQTKDERLDGNWSIDEVTNANGENVTAQFADWTLFAEQSKEGKKQMSLFKDGVLFSFGSYSFADYSDYLIIVYTTYQGIDVSGEVVQDFLEVRKLTDKWLYYIDEEGVEFHWKKY